MCPLQGSTRVLECVFGINPPALTISLRPHQKRAISAMQKHNRGQIVVPTGGGKTICMIEDAKQEFTSDNPKTIVVVAPRILLANQLCSEFLELIDNANAIHVHSGDTRHFSTTNPQKIKLAVGMCQLGGCHQLIFTTYHSLHRIQEAGINVDTIYFDEAHNSCQRNFFSPTEFFSANASRVYFFTATRRTSLTISKPGMNDVDVYGQVIYHIPAPQLVKEGYILPPKVFIKELPRDDAKQSDCKNLMDTISDINIDKILIAARSTQQIVRLVTQSDFTEQLEEIGYNWMYITSKTGAIINGKKVSRECFFKTLNQWGADNTRFVIMHHSILSEGINVKGLEAVLFMRNMDYIGIQQSIGRVIRLGGTEKTHGLVCVPVCDRVGVSTARSVQAVVDVVFDKGEMMDSVVRR